MHVVNLIQCTELGGMEQAALRVLVGLQARGHTCEVVSTNPLGALGPILASHKIPALGVPFRGRAGWRSHLALRCAVHPRVAGAQAVLMTGPTLTGLLCLRRRQRPHQVLMVQYHHSGVKHPLSWWTIYQLAVSRFAAIAFPSDFIRAEAEEICPAVRSIAHTIFNPVAIPAPTDAGAKAAARAALGLPVDGLLVGNAGWLIPRKRFDVFLRIAARVRAVAPSARFVIAGDGPERARLEALAAEIGVAPAVHWLGWRKNLDPVYRALDVLVFNSDWDAFGNTPIEAMSYGLPVVASVVHGGLGEALSSAEFGTLLNTHDEPALAAAVTALLYDPAAATRMGRAARAHVSRTCSLESRAEAYERLLIGGKAPTA
jgi:glycosyltransferase involved in cell wall biosynthesis